VEGELGGILTIAVAIAAISAGAGIYLLGLPLWAGLLLYSASGTAALLVLAWRRYRCAELNAKRTSRV